MGAWEENMNRKTVERLLVAVGVISSAVLPSGAARAAGAGGYAVEVLVDGLAVPEYTASGGVYLEALRGREYAIRLTNRTPDRVGVALSVDGLNTIDARHTTAAAGRKWILGPWESVTISGWQTDGATARRFFFTTESGSYGAWLGRTRDLGGISAAFFPELRRPTPLSDTWSGRGPARSDAPDPRYGERGRQAPAQGSAAGDAGAARKSKEANAARPDSPVASEQVLSDEYAATGIGGTVNHPVQLVNFEHGPHPAAVVQLRYEFRDTLVRLGVFPTPPPCPDGALARRERARGFDDGPWAPDPYRPR